jgi:heme exporter protein C
MFTSLANPERFTRLTAPIRPFLVIGTGLLLVWGLYLCFASPEDYQQKDTVRIMYVHVPAAWMGLFIYLLVGLSGFFGLIYRHPFAEAALRALTPIGAVFTGLALLTGALWGQPMWGTPWQWDGRMTSVLILFLFYLALMALRAALDDENRAARLSSVLALIGLVNLPIIKFSVEWWNSLHQGASVFRPDGPTISTDMLWPLLVMAIAYKCLAIWLFLARLETEQAERRAHRYRLLLAHSPQGGPYA